MTQKQINDKFLDKLAQFEYDDFYALLDGIGKGDKGCFRIGMILAKNSHQYGYMASDIFEAFATLVEEEPEFFAEYSRQYPISDLLMADVMRIPDWMVMQYRREEVIDSIDRRKEYLMKYGLIDVLAGVNYEHVLAEMERLSRTHVEKKAEDGVRVVYSSNIEHLVSDKPYPLTNMVDGDKNTAWCVDYKKSGKLPVIRVDVYTENMKCKGKKNTDRCSMKGVEMAFRSGYQKNSSVYKNNSRIKAFVLATKNLGYDEVRDDKRYTLSDVPEIKRLMIPSNKKDGAGLYNPVLFVRVESAYPGDKFPELCISELSAKVIQ